MEKRIGIVGAGISGLLACKYALSKGFNPIVFESSNAIGGVWTKTVETTKLQTLKPYYQFSDFPWPSSVQTPFPNNQQVLDYLQSYANHFDLLKHIRFNTKVISINYEDVRENEMESWTLWGGNGGPFSNKGKWAITVEHLKRRSTQVIRVDFVIVCVGRFSGVPNIPVFTPGKGVDKGCEVKVMHTIEYSAMDDKSAKSFIKGKQVTIVGYGKSAFDIAMQCSKTNGVENPCTMICRTPHWTVPETSFWTFPLKYMFLNRFAELWVRKPGDGLLLFLLALLLWPLRWFVCKVLERTLKSMQQLEKYGLLPDLDFSTELKFCLVSIIPDGFYDALEEGSIVVKRVPTFSFCENGVTLLDNNNQAIKTVKSDVVLFATGFKGEQKVQKIFASSKFQDYIMGSRSKLAPLHRGCVHPRIPQLAVVGFNNHSLSCLYSSELECRWLVEFLDGNIKLPSINQMEEDILAWENLVSSYSNSSKRRCVGALHIWQNDRICKDMGLNPKRKDSFWAELFEPYSPMDYAQT